MIEYRKSEKVVILRELRGGWQGKIRFAGFPLHRFLPRTGAWASGQS
jgi:hypothetical protein